MNTIHSKAGSSCADIICANDVMLLRAPIEQDSLNELQMKYSWPGSVEVLDYIDFGLPKGTECRTIGEEDYFWKVQLTRGEINYKGFIPKELNGKATLQRNCDLVNEVADIRESMLGLDYPDWVQGTYEASGQGIRFTLKVFREGLFLKANLESYNPNFGWKTYNDIDCFYSPQTEAISFPGIVNRCEIKMLDSVKFNATSGNFRLTGRRSD